MARLTKLAVANGTIVLLAAFVWWSWFELARLIEGTRPLVIISMPVSGSFVYAVARSAVLLLGVFAVPCVIVTIFGQLATSILEEGFKLD